MCGPAKKTVVETPIKKAINAFRASQDNLSEAGSELLLQARKAEAEVVRLGVVIDNANRERDFAVKAADDLSNTVLEQARLIVNLEQQLVEASQRIAPVEDEYRELFAERDVDTSPVIDAADVGGTPSRRGRVAIERKTYKQGVCGGSNSEWVQVDVVEAGDEENTIRFLRDEDGSEYRAVTLVEAL